MKILTIDGGGIRGIIPAQWLVNFEESQGPCYKFFNLIGGTSTGGIIALGLSLGIPAKQLLKLYIDEAEHIFYRPWYRKTNLWRSKYSSKGLLETLKKYFGDATFKDVRCSTAVTAYEISCISQGSPTKNIRGSGPIFLSSNSSYDDWKLYEVAMCTSAAPTYFPPFVKNNNVYIDGGVWANNPTAAIREFFGRYSYRNIEDIWTISLGTGKTDGPYLSNGNKDGLLEIGPQVLPIMFSAQAELSHRLMLSKPHSELGKPGDTYHRYQIDIPVKNISMDNVSYRNLSELIIFGQKMKMTEDTWHTYIQK